MGTTANRAYPYPENSDLVTNGAAAMKSLAEAVDADLAGTDGDPTAASGVSFNSTTKVYRRGELVALLLDITCTAAKAPGAVLLTVPAGYRPGVTWQILAHNLTAGGVVLLNLNTNGDLVPAAVTITAGHRLLTTAAWPIA